MLFKKTHFKFFKFRLSEEKIPKESNSCKLFSCPVVYDKHFIVFHMSQHSNFHDKVQH